jgi:hypothetical protein
VQKATAFLWQAKEDGQDPTQVADRTVELIDWGSFLPQPEGYDAQKSFVASSKPSQLPNRFRAGVSVSAKPNRQKEDSRDMDTLDPIAELTAAIAAHRQVAALARTGLEAAIPALVAAIRHGSGQSAKVEAVLWNLWNGELCESLAGLDPNLAEAVVAMIAARAHLAGDADDLLRKIIRESGSQPPTAP